MVEWYTFTYRLSYDAPIWVLLIDGSDVVETSFMRSLAR